MRELTVTIEGAMGAAREKLNKDSSPATRKKNTRETTTATSALSERVAKKLLEEATDSGRSVAELIVEAVNRANPALSMPVKLGQDDVKLVLTFAHGQSTSLKLKLRDRDGITSEPPKLDTVTINGAKIMIQDATEAGQSCWRDGHLVPSVAKTMPIVAGKQTLVPLVCETCGDMVRIRLTDHSDIDAALAVQMASRASGPWVAKHLEDIDRMRRRLAKRQEELAEAQEALDQAATMLAGTILEQIMPA